MNHFIYFLLGFCCLLVFIMVFGGLGSGAYILMSSYNLCPYTPDLFRAVLLGWGGIMVVACFVFACYILGRFIWFSVLGRH